ncbi:MAG: LysM peptidoglycan-binding domain-containing protein [Bacteroidota bacterium]
MSTKIKLHLHLPLAILVMVLIGFTAIGQPANLSAFKLEPMEGLVNREGELRAGLLYDINKNTIVWEKRMDEAFPIASLTKMMVALLAVEDIAAQKRDWSDEITVTRSYKKSPRSRKVITTTETYTLESLVQLAMIPSNNQACSDIGKHLCGSIDDFMLRMNARAAELGMTSTFFSTPSGLPAAIREFDNKSSPNDLLKLCLELLKYDDILRITSIGYAEISNNKSKAIHRNHNRLVIDYDEHVDGLKTGYTRRAGFCLAATSKQDDVRLISIVLGVGSSYVRNDIVAGMLNNYYSTIGCGPMKPSFKVPTPVSAPAVAQADSGVVYKTVWTKQWKTYRVRSGETLSSIAQKHKSTYTQLKKWNSLKSDRIHPGQQLRVFVNVKKTVAIRINPTQDDQEDDDADTNDDVKKEVVAKLDSVATPKEPVELAVNTTANEKPVTTKAKPAPAKKTPAVKYVYHTVQPGDTLWSIARKYRGVSANDIKQTNKLPNADVIKPGTKLKIKLG